MQGLESVLGVTIDETAAQAITAHIPRRRTGFGEDILGSRQEVGVLDGGWCRDHKTKSCARAAATNPLTPPAASFDGQMTRRFPALRKKNFFCVQLHQVGSTPKIRGAAIMLKRFFVASYRLRVSPSPPSHSTSPWAVDNP